MSSPPPQPTVRMSQILTKSLLGEEPSSVIWGSRVPAFEAFTI